MTLNDIYANQTISIDRVAGEIIRLVASVCLCVHPFVFVRFYLNRLTLIFGMRVDLDL